MPFVRRSAAALVILSMVVPFTARAAAADAPTGCSSEAPEAATTTLVAPRARIVERAPVAGFETVLALDPYVQPGIRHRLIAAGGFWCDATTAFNAAWRLGGRRGSAVDMASSFAMLAASPYFDSVTVKAARMRAPGVVALTTHARTNGIDASWVVSVDGAGVREARWEATAFAVAPLDAEPEGITALPGAMRRYVRTSSGALRATEKDPWLVAAPVDGPLASYTASDGFTIDVWYGAAPAPTIGVATGVNAIDIIDKTTRVAAENYEEFLTWGVRKGWLQESGTIFINDPLSLYCLACVISSSIFQIHMFSEVVTLLSRLNGVRYPDNDKALSLIIGHEMFHNFQSAHAFAEGDSPIGSGVEGSVSEGTARFQETIHTYAEISNQKYSLVRATDANGCNGFDSPSMDESLLVGPFYEKSYSACYFWMSWYRDHGVSGLVRLLDAERTAKSLSGSIQVTTAIEIATGRPFAEDLLRFAEGALTGFGYSWGPVAGGPAIDWGANLDRWKPGAAPIGSTAQRTLGRGGLVGFSVSATTRITSDNDSVLLASIRSNGTTSAIAVIASGEVITAPAAGEKVWVVAASPNASGTEVGLAFSAA